MVVTRDEQIANMAITINEKSIAEVLQSEFESHLAQLQNDLNTRIDQIAILESNIIEETHNHIEVKMKLEKQVTEKDAQLAAKEQQLLGMEAELQN